MAQIDAHRIRRGVWNENARPDYMEDQYAINLLLSRLSMDDREVLAKMITSAVETGVFETLKALEQYQVEPLRSGYEGVLSTISSVVFRVGSGQTNDGVLMLPRMTA